MSFQFGDPGGRMYTTVGASQVNLLAHWNGPTNVPSNFSVSAGNGRSGGSSLRMIAGNDTYISKVLNAQPTWGIAFAYRTTGLGGVTLFRIWDITTTQVDLRQNPDGSLSVTRNGTILGTTAVGLIPVNAYSHIEWKSTIHPSAGTTQVWINGVERLNLTGQNTRTTANSYGTTIVIGLSSFGTGHTWDFDDIIFYDGVATDAAGNADITGPIGDCGLGWFLPTGAGATTNFTPSSGANYAAVNDATPNGDTSYAESSTINHIDTYSTADLPASASSIKSYAVVSFARKSDVGLRVMAPVVRTGGVDYPHPTSISLGDSYQYHFRSWGENPGTTNPWSVSEINALEVGQKVIS